MHSMKRRLMYCKYFGCSHVEKCNVGNEVTVDNRAYVDIALFTQNDSYNNTLKFNTLYAEHFACRSVSHLPENIASSKRPTS